MLRVPRLGEEVWEQRPSSGSFASLGYEEPGALKTPTQMDRKLGMGGQGGEQQLKPQCMPGGGRDTAQSSPLLCPLESQGPVNGVPTVMRCDPM